MNIVQPAKEESGVTLIELVIVASIIGILALAMTFSYRGWLGNYKIESELKQMYIDIMDARTRAMTQNRMHFVVINADNYAIYEDTNENNAADPGSGDNPIPEYRDPATLLVKTKLLEYDLGWTGTITFNTKGLTTSAAAISIPIILPDVDARPDFDCIMVYQSRVRMGQMPVLGGNCVEK